jgi:eukaryotic-like serine/threonine-protein kinase
MNSKPSVLAEQMNLPIAISIQRRWLSEEDLSMNEREIFLAARAMDDPEQQREFVHVACAGNADLLESVFALLDADRKTGGLFTDRNLSATQESSPADQIGTSIGPYKLLEVIGEGGFGIVYMAEQSEPVRRLVALKVIKPGMDSKQVIARFEAERQALAVMDHPHIARIFDAGTTASGSPYFVMELVKGIPISQFCDEGRLSIAKRLELFVSVCHAIQHAHSKGIIHRDIKPSNVLVAMYDQQAVPKVIDFGIAKATGQALSERTLHTGFGAIIGSLEYMSPEQATLNQLDVDTRSDIYSLGVLLYELLTGGPPIRAAELKSAGLLESLRLVRELEPPMPSLRLSSVANLDAVARQRAIEPFRLTPFVRGDLDWIVMKSLEKDRSRRYETVNHLADEIVRFLHGNPVLAHPPHTSYLIGKWLRRHRQGLLAATAILLGLAFLGGTMLNQAWHRQAEQTRHSSLIASAIRESQQQLVVAKRSPIGKKEEWVAARGMAGHLRELAVLSPLKAEAQAQYEEFLETFNAADADRRLAETIEQVVISSATNQELASWENMEREFQQFFSSQGIRLGELEPDEIGRRIRQHPSSDKLSDALELLIGTKGQISALGGAPATRESMQPLADAMFAADSDPVRTGIRKLIYGQTKATEADVDQIIDGQELDQQTPRTLSWLATAYAMAGANAKCDQVFHQAILKHPDDFMLSFDYAYMLASQKRWPDAIRYYLRCTAIRPEVPGIWQALGQAYGENGEKQRAEEALHRAKALEAAMPTE